MLIHRDCQSQPLSFDISQYGLEQSEIRTFTTRIDTIYGVTFIVMAPEHPLVQKLVTENHRDEVEKYIDQARRQTEVERLSTEHEKTGVFIGSFAINHLNGEPVPLFIADYALLSYGTGIVMGVPAHDQRPQPHFQGAVGGGPLSIGSGYG